LHGETTAVVSQATGVPHYRLGPRTDGTPHQTRRGLRVGRGSRLAAEIAFWNLAIYIVIAQALRADDPVSGRAVAIALVTLQLLVATNHAEAAIASHAMLNVVMSAINYSCAAFGILALRVRPAGQTPPE
jgi:hypothetical protein